jgi:ABC-type sugar transport system permease subunit
VFTKTEKSALVINEAGKLKEGIPEKRLKYYMVAPAIIIILLIAVYPIMKTIYNSLFSMQLQDLDGSRFVGIHNYKA